MAGIDPQKEGMGDYTRAAVAVKQPSIMDLRPSKGLAAGLKRTGGRGGISRLSRGERKTISGARKGRPVVLHNF